MSPDQTSYLDRIKVTPELWNSWVRKYIANIRFVILLVISIVAIGLFSYFSLPQRLNPEINLPIISVITTLPGASPEDVESLVTIPLEDELIGLSGLDTIASTSQNNASIITMQFVSSVTAEKAKQQVKDAVESVNDLPADASVPSVEAFDFENQPVWVFAISSDADTISLSEFAKKLKKSIEDISTVDKVQVRGVEDTEIRVSIDQSKLAKYQLNPLTLSSKLKSQIKAFPAGSIESSNYVYSLTLDPTISNVDGIRKTMIDIDGQNVRLEDIATVQEVSKPDIKRAYIISPNGNPEKVVTFTIYKSTNADIVKTVEEIKPVVEEQLSVYNGEFKLTTIQNTGEMIQDQFFDLLGEFRSTIILVFVCLLLFLGLRQAVIASFTVPLTFLASFIFMKAVGMSINFLSLFAFLLALGLLVDDTIVVVSAMTTYFKTKKFSSLETGVLVWKDTIVPIWSTTITTIWSFVPLLLATGIIGEFIKPIPVVVTFTMVSSTAIAVLITLPVMIVLLNPSVPRRVLVLVKILSYLVLAGVIIGVFSTTPLFIPIALVFVLIVIVLTLNKQRFLDDIKFRVSEMKNFGLKAGVFQLRINFIKNHKSKLTRLVDSGLIDVEGFAKGYERFISSVLESKSKRKFIVISIVAYAIFSFALLPLGLVKNEFFPGSHQELIYMSLKLPDGSTSDVTEKKALEVLPQLNNIEGVDFVTLEIGAQAQDGGGFSSQQDENNIALYTLHLPKHPKKTTQDSIHISQMLRDKYKNYTDAKLSVVELTDGPPAGAEVSITLAGDDLTKLEELTNQVQDYLSKQNGVINIEKSVKSGTSAVVFVPNQQKLQTYGLSNDNIGYWLRTLVSGFELDSVSFDKSTNEKTPVIFKIGDDSTPIEEVLSLTIPTQSGQIALNQLGKLAPKTNPTIINREDGKRVVTVSAGLKQGFNSQEVNGALLKHADTIPLPAGYSWKTGGVNEENTKSVQSILMAMGVAFLLILVTMVIQFQSFRQALIVLLVIPLAVSSVFLVFAITGTPLSFPALIGVLSLFGIVVTNSMFIVDKINLNLREGMEFKHAIADAGASRMEPIILTKLCTVFGLLPITLADPLWRGLGGAIISGLLIASTIMLLFIPVVYFNWMKQKNSQ